ncbi:MAG: hypothetical protein BA874_08530 [Desulfuromonadales bacterium C00003068]|jgi:hypothetical protein|nr:MAG: hypothetical protein BA874_08530 [Desulfuromonadales bacterium C00003068]
MHETTEQQSSHLAYRYTQLFNSFFAALDHATAEPLHETLKRYPTMGQELFYLFSGILCMNTRHAVNREPNSSQTLFGAFTLFSDKIPQILIPKNEQASFNHKQIQCVNNCYSKSERNQLAALFLNRSIGDNYRAEYPASTEIESALVAILDHAEKQLLALL